MEVPVRKFNYQIVLQCIREHEKDNYIVFSGIHYDNDVESLVANCLDSITDSRYYDVVQVNFQPFNLDDNGKKKD